MVERAAALDWRPIDTLEEVDFVLLRDAAHLVQAGGRENGALFKEVDGDRYPIGWFEPIEWAEAPDDIFAAFAET